MSVLVDGEGRARAIVETTRVEVVPFDEIGEDFASALGECARTLAWFRDVIGSVDWSPDKGRLGLAHCPPDGANARCRSARLLGRQPIIDLATDFLIAQTRYALRP